MISSSRQAGEREVSPAAAGDARLAAIERTVVVGVKIYRDSVNRRIRAIEHAVAVIVLEHRAGNRPNQLRGDRGIRANQAVTRGAVEAGLKSRDGGIVQILRGIFQDRVNLT